MYSDEPSVTEIMSGKAFFGLQEANDGSIWFGDATGVYSYNPSAGGKTITDFYRKDVRKKYIIDTKQSAVVWKGSWLLGGWEGAKFLGDGTNTGDVDILKGELLINNRQLLGGSFEVDMKTIENFVDQRSLNQLPPFFDVKKFPVSTFAITKVEKWSDGNLRNEGNLKITGNLTIEGIIKAVTFPARMYFKDGMDGTVEINGTLIVDRTDWGIDYNSEEQFAHSGDAILNDVKLLIHIVAKK